MKKLRTTLFVCLTALAVLTAFGCKQGGQEIGTGETGKWHNQTPIAKVGKTLELTNNTDSIIDWWLIADTKGEVLAYKNQKSLDADVLTAVSTKENINPKEKLTFTFSDNFFTGTSKDIVLYISMPTYQPKDENYTKGKTDYRGTVTVQRGSGVAINADKYSKEVEQIAIYTLQNNEYGKGTDKPTADSGIMMQEGNWHGDYKITGLTVLEPVDSSTTGFTPGAKFRVVSGINYDFTNNPIEEGKQRSIVITVPKENTFFAIGLKQPNRFTDEDKSDSEYSKQKNWIWVKKLTSTEVHEEITRTSKEYEGKIDLQGKEYVVPTTRNVAPTLYEFIPAVPGEK